MEKKIQRFCKLYPWYSGFTADLLFYIAIDTMFLSFVKEFTAAEIVSITSIAQLVCMALQFPILFVMKKIGNTASVRTGAFLLFASSVFITFGKTYFLVLFARIMHDAAAVFKTAGSFAVLENNLDLAGKRSEFIRLRTTANTIYAIITMLISFVASYMFNLYNYLPMWGCIACCGLGFVLSLFIKDYSPFNKDESKRIKREKVKIHYSKIIVMLIIVYAIFYAAVSSAQNEGKLFIQEILLLDFDKEKTTLIVGVIVAASRVIRVFSNMIFAKIYEKYQAKMGFALPALLAISVALLLFGSFVPQIIVKILLMGFGYTIILFARDPFNLYMQDVVFENTPKEQHKTLLTILNFGTKLGIVGMGLVFSAILVSYPMLLVMAILLSITVIEIFLSVILYRAVLLGKKQKAAEMSEA